MKTGKRILSLLLAMVLVFAMVPSGVLVAQAYSGTCGDNLTWRLSNGTLTISGTGAITDYDYSNLAPWFNYCSSITSAVVADGVTSPGDYCFYWCSSLTSISIPDSVTSLGDYCFADCDSLTSTTIPDSVTSLGEGCFTSCESLTSITIPDSVTRIDGWAFSFCQNLTSITVEAGNTVFHSAGNCLIETASKTLLAGCNTSAIPADGSVTGIADFAFSSCNSLTSITIPDSVASLGDSCFTCCESLTSITIPDSVTSLGDGCFASCDSLTEIVVDESNPCYQSLDGVLYDKKLERLIQCPGGKVGVITIPSSVTNLSDSCFHGCYFLTGITIPDSVTSLGDSCFSSCHSLTSITIPDSVTSLGDYCFQTCSSLTSIIFQGNAPSIANSAFMDVTATAYYPSGTETWTEDVRQDYGGTLTWEPYEHDHNYRKTVVSEQYLASEAGCTQPATYYCSCWCGAMGEETFEHGEALGHDYVDGICTRCGELLGVIRLAGASRWATGLKVADEMKENLGAQKFDAIIVASGNDFADALAGSYLSTVKDAPILLAWGKGGRFQYLDTDNINYIKNNLAEGGTVYLLGGENAVPELYKTELAQFNVVRLGGANRFETNLLILEEAGIPEGSEILVCTSTNFADSLSASATGLPILLVFNESGKLYGDQPDFLAGLNNCTFTVIGGESAVSEKLVDVIGEYGDVTRLAGGNRFETSVLVAEKYFDAPETAVLAYAWNYPDGLCGGALAYSLDAPLILTMTKYEAKAAAYAKEAGITQGVVLGGTSLISDAAVRAIFEMSADDVILVK